MYVSMKQPNAMETNCERCHSPAESRSHTVHAGKVDCKACHQRHVVSCTNCHFATLLNEGKRISIPVSGWLFLMNLNRRVTSANMQSFVVEGNKTFLMFAPQHSHSIMAKGRTCNDCHASPILNEIETGSVRLTWLEDGKMKNAKGMIPVTDAIAWEMSYQDREQGTWIPISDPAKPKLHYAGYGAPLTKAQVQSLRKPQVEMKKKTQ
jgi:hypothetical protein